MMGFLEKDCFAFSANLVWVAWRWLHFLGSLCGLYIFGFILRLMGSRETKLALALIGCRAYVIMGSDRVSLLDVDGMVMLERR